MRTCVCASCGASFVRYRMNATRAARPQFCSKECLRLRPRARPEAFKERLFSKIPFGDPPKCWEWQGRRDRNGYGRIDRRQEGDHRAYPMLAHRMTYQELRGPVSDDLAVCHACDNPPCCNPHHLWLGTQTENNRDRDAKGRTRLA